MLVCEMPPLRTLPHASYSCVLTTTLPAPLAALALPRWSVCRYVTAPVPLSLMTPESKAGLLNWLREQADARPGEPKWKDLLAKFDKALASPR